MSRNDRFVRDGKFIYYPDLIKNDIKCINEAIDDCDYKLAVYKGDKEEALNELASPKKLKEVYNELIAKNYNLEFTNYSADIINNLEINRDILKFKKHAIEKASYEYSYLGHYIVDNLILYYGYNVYGFGYNTYIRDKKYKDSNQKNLERKISQKIHEYLRSHSWYVSDELADIENSNPCAGYYKEQDAKQKFIRLNSLLYYNVLDDMVDELFDLDIDNLEEIVDSNQLIPAMRAAGIIKAEDNQKIGVDAVFSAFFDRYVAKINRLASPNSCDNKIKKSMQEIIAGLFCENTIDYMYSDDEIEYFKKCIDLNDLKIDSEEHQNQKVKK